MTKKPTVSVIVPTYNSSATLAACLQSIREQTYTAELIVVDNHSEDNTKAIAEQFADKVYTKGPERSAQRNFGVSKATGEYVLIIDSDMELTPKVVEQCVEQFKDSQLLGLVIPEESFGEGFWAQCKKLERSFYVGVEWMEAARAYRSETYLEVGGYNEDMVSGEDWDLSHRVAEVGKLGRIEAYIMHNEGRLHMHKTLLKKYYYAKSFSNYKREKTSSTNLALQAGPTSRYKLFFSNPNMLFKEPLTGIGMLVMKTSEFTVGGLGILVGKLEQK